MERDRDLKAWRRSERERLIAARLAIGPELRHRWNVDIEPRLLALLDHLTGDTLGIYWPHKGEFDPRPIGERLIGQGRSIALPAIVDPGGVLEYRLWHPGMEMQAGAFGIPVPRRRQIVYPDMLLAPLLGFDAENYRLGYGGGYFDRTLAAMDPRPIAIGLGFETSRIATVFPQPHDIAMDFIVTEAEIQKKPT